MNAISTLNHRGKKISLLAAICIILLLFTNNRDLALTLNTQSGGLLLPKGFSSTVVADSIGQGRHIAVNSNGDIYVSLERLKKGKGIVALRDMNGDGKAEIIKYFGSLTGTGIAINNGYLYFASDTMIMRYKLNPTELLPNLSYEVVARGFPLTRQHSAKTFTFDNEGNLYVNIGAPSNACQSSDRTPNTPGTNPCPLLKQFGGIWKFKANTTGQDQMKDGYRYATGLRNCVAIEWNQAANKLFVVQHGRDQLRELWPEFYTEDQGVNLPAEEFFLLKDGSDCGWPYTYFDDAKNMKMLAPEYGGNGKLEDKSGKQKPIMTFPAHYAPNDLLFYTGDQFPLLYKNGAFIAFHGSWNRAPQEQKGYNVVFVPFQKDLPSGKWDVFADHFAGVSKIESPRDAKHRPCGLAQGPEGSLYVVEDVQGKIWKITYH